LSSSTKARSVLRLLTGCGDRARAPWCLDRVCRRRLTWCVLFAIFMSHMNAAHCISRRVQYSKVLRHGTNNDLTTQRERSVPMMHRSSPRRLRRSQRLQVSAMEPTAKLKLCNKKRWRNWITGGCEKGGWHRVSRIKEKRVMEGKEEYNVAWTGWGRNQKDSWVSSDDVTPKCIEAWRKAVARRIQAPYCRGKQDRLERNSVIKLQAFLRGHSAVRAFATRTPPLTPTATPTPTPTLTPTPTPTHTPPLTPTLTPTPTTTMQDFDRRFPTVWTGTVKFKLQDVLLRLHALDGMSHI